MPSKEQASGITMLAACDSLSYRLESKPPYEPQGLQVEKLTVGWRGRRVEISCDRMIAVRGVAVGRGAVEKISIQINILFVGPPELCKAEWVYGMHEHHPASSWLRAFACLRQPG